MTQFCITCYQEGHTYVECREVSFWDIMASAFGGPCPSGKSPAQVQADFERVHFGPAESATAPQAADSATSTPAKDRTMKVIYKHTLEIIDRQTLVLGANDEPLSLQFQGDRLCLWVLHDPNDQKVQREFAIYGTGQQVEQAAGDYIGTVQQPGLSLVWHVFEVREGALTARAA